MTQTGQLTPQITETTPLAAVRWYAVYAAPCREKRVAEDLTTRGFESFLPLYRSPRRWKNGCRVELQSVLFPGYVFARMNCSERVRVLETPNVISIVSRGRVPEPLEDDAIADLHKIVALHRAQPHPYLTVGERVSVCAGPFAGLSGIVLRSNGALRVVIALSLIMQSIAVEVSTEDVVPFPDRPSNTIQPQIKVLPPPTFKNP
jgi:transcription antitermination factor NusG